VTLHQHAASDPQRQLRVTFGEFANDDDTNTASLYIRATGRSAHKTLNKTASHVHVYQKPFEQYTIACQLTFCVVMFPRATHHSVTQTQNDTP
jgi:hypothetical protein